MQPMAKGESVKKILVVDDEQDIGFLMKMLLRPEGYDVYYVKTLSEAKKALSENTFHTVFLDLNLENEYGLDLVPIFRSQDYPPTIAVITAQKEPRVRAEIESSKVDYLIEKPFNKTRLLEVLQTPL